MPSIYLKETERTYNSGSTSVNVTCEDYTPSKLFKRYKHEFTSAAAENIWVYNGQYEWSNYFTLKSDNGDSRPTLKEAHVYFNKYDTNHENPLLFVLKFDGGASPGDKYYTRTQFNDKFSNDGGQSVGISSLHTYDDNEGSILQALLTENDKLTDLLTYNIGRKEGDSNGNGKYNGGKICVQDDTGSEPKLSGYQFTRYKHTPVGDNTGKKACVIYDGDVLLDDSQTELSGIQGQQYDSIVVYMGEKAKKTSSTSGAGQGLSDTYPLLIELTKTTNATDPEYYVHKRNPEDQKYYWEDLLDTGGMALGDLLVDMGFGMEKSENGYDQLKQLLSTAGVSVDDASDDLSDKLTGLKGSQLQAMLKETVGDIGTGSQKSLLRLLLQKIEFDLLDSVVILLEKTGTGSSTYGEGEVSAVVSQLKPKRHINRVSMNGGQNIQVSNATANNGQCVQKYGYKLISHNISEFVKYTLTLSH